MYKIETKPYGFMLTFDGLITADEMTKWVEESKSTIKSHAGKFDVLVDMRGLKPLAKDVQGIMENGQKLYKAAGMERSAVIVNSALTAMQFKRLAQNSGIYQWERFIDASANPNWEQIAIDWLTKAVDPDKKETTPA